MRSQLCISSPGVDMQFLGQSFCWGGAGLKKSLEVHEGPLPHFGCAAIGTSRAATGSQLATEKTTVHAKLQLCAYCRLAKGGWVVLSSQTDALATKGKLHCRGQLYIRLGVDVDQRWDTHVKDAA